MLRVLDAMGLADVRGGLAGILSPDTAAADVSTTDDDERMSSYPTKSSPREYYARVLGRHHPSSHDIVLLDDSSHNIRTAESVGIRGVRVHPSSSGRTLEEGLAEALGHVLPATAMAVAATGETEGGGWYEFSDVRYLKAKNEVDANAIDPNVWEELARRLSSRLERPREAEETVGNTLRVADLGAGMLSMVDLMLNGGGEGDREKEGMLALMDKFMNGKDRVAMLEYFAYESNSNLFKGCKEKLLRLGFEETTRQDDSSDGEATFTRAIEFSDESGTAVEVSVHIRPIDFQAEERPPEGLDLVIGCCFADLLLSLALHRFALDGHPLVYFPITFAGTTQFDPPHPAVVPARSRGRGMVPSDTTAFGIYTESLTNHGHNLDPSSIVKAMAGRGGSLIAKGQSDWIIDPRSDGYLWETMMYFFGMSGAREMLGKKLDAAGWIARCRADPRTILVSNVDLLFHLRDVSSLDEADVNERKSAESESGPSIASVQEIQFVAPYNVTTITKHWNTSSSGHLSPNQVEVESSVSLISSGTELKIFRGSFESAALDVNIKGMDDESMEYPLAYGYSLVGQVVACGSDVKEAETLIGKLVFTFSPHSTRVIVDRDALQVVPDGISAEDAVFMPSVETALSLVHDAHVRFGENVAVYGQGLIGLLVTGILSTQSRPLFSTSKPFGAVTTFDTFDDRLRISSLLGATSALKPNAASLAGPFDVSIEVSGNPRALQSAIDHTANHGRIIVGSWYGNTDVALKLGIEFHRSHKTIQTSQVSTIPPALTGLWSKERRFELTWALVQSLRPSRLITKQLTLEEAQRAYELLDSGKEIAVTFKYMVVESGLPSSTEYTNDEKDQIRSDRSWLITF